MSYASSAALAAAKPDMPQPVNGKKRFFDAASETWAVKVMPGEFYVARKSDEVIVTILGSCVSACVRDPVAGIGGMNHFMLPEGATQAWNGESESTRFGNFAMEKLINELLKAGCRRDSLEIKVFGGASVIRSRAAVGNGNSRFILDYLDAEGLSCAAHDLGGNFPRRIHYYPSTGRVVRRFLNNSSAADVATEETAYARQLSVGQTSGDIELFER